MQIRRLLFSLPMLALGALLCAPATGSAQTILQSAGNFTLLGGTFITNSGGTVISGGNVGLSPGPTSNITGFFTADGGTGVITPPGAIIPTGPVTDQAMADLMNVATKLNLMPSNTNLTNQNLGGMTLIPGVYTFNVAADQALSTTLTLDAQGQNGVFWVFQIGTSLTTGANANVTIVNLGTNLGSDDGIFWNAGSTIIFGADNLIVGNYLAGTGITAGVNTSGSGRTLAQTAITLSNNALDSHGGPGSSAWDGGLMFNGLGNIVPVPEPAVFSWLAAFSALGLVFWRRQVAANKLVA